MKLIGKFMNAVTEDFESSIPEAMGGPFGSKIPGHPVTGSHPLDGMFGLAVQDNDGTAGVYFFKSKSDQQHYAGQMRGFVKSLGPFNKQCPKGETVDTVKKKLAGSRYEHATIYA